MLALVVSALLVAAPTGGPPRPVATTARAVTSVPAPRGLEQRLLTDAKDGRLDEMTLLEAALVASGVPDKEVAAEAERARKALAPAIARAKAKQGRARGDALLRALHETVFRKYAAQASEIDGVVRDGEFNCLSSALLYVVAAEGLFDAPRGTRQTGARAMVTRHHAFARVLVDGEAVDVETTTPIGFGADRDALMTPAFVKQIAGPDTTPQELLADLKSPEELPLLSLVAGVYSNRAVALAARGDLGGATVALDRAARLASGGLKSRAAAWRAGVLNDGALALADEGRLDDARALLELALDGTQGETRKLVRTNLATMHLRIADAAIARSDWTAALDAVAAAERHGAESKHASPLRARANAELAALDGNDKRCNVGKAPAREAAACLANLARSLRDSGAPGDLDRALQHARRAHALAPDDEDAVRALFYTLAGKARVEGERGRCDVVEGLVREAMPHLQRALGDQAHGKPSWSAVEVMAACWARAGDKAFDAKDWAVASSRYARARTHLPQDAALRQNLAAVDLNRAIELGGRGACDDARPYARRAARMDAKLDDKATRVLESCAAVRAKSAADAKDWPRAAAELRRGLRDAPASAALRQNLATMLHNVAGDLLRARRCDDARALLPEFEALPGAHDGAAVRAIREACAR